MSDSPTDTDAAAFVAHWMRIGPLLNQAEREELRSLTDEQHLAAIASVLSLARPEHGNGGYSGLVQQQQLFAKGRR